MTFKNADMPAMPTQNGGGDIYGGGKELPGLVKRRGDEYRLCMKDEK